MLEVLTKEQLGKKRICFGNKKENHFYLQSRLEKGYPKLVSKEGVFQLFLVLSGGSDIRESMKILVWPCGYTMLWLKFGYNMSSCSVYVMPCQIKLSVEPEIKTVTLMII